MSGNQDNGQELAERLIKNAWENRRLAFSYLFFGPAGTGRLFMARKLAKTVNCEVGSFPPCLVCSSCKKIESNNHPDVHYIEKQNSSFIKIEQIHDMQREIFLHPFEAKYKVFIVMNAEDLTAEAANCLLKILEESPKDSLIILIASDLRRIFPTIVSRCQKVMFNTRDPKQLESILKDNYHLDINLSHFLSFIFEGRLGEALRFKDRNTLNEKNRIIGCFMPQIFANLSHNAWQMPGEHNKFDYKDKDELNWIIKILVTCVRDVYLIKIGSDKNKLINQDIRGELSVLAGELSFADLDQILKQLCDARELIQQNVNPRLLIENLKLLWRK